MGAFDDFVNDCINDSVNACQHSYVRVSSFGWFRCSHCGKEAHSLACVDDSGRVECCCGLADALELEAMARGEL